MRIIAASCSLLLALSGCAGPPSGSMTTAGQLFCRISTSGGSGLVVKMVSATDSSAAILATDATAAAVQAACAAWDPAAVPVPPPAAPEAVAPVSIVPPPGVATAPT